MATFNINDVDRRIQYTSTGQTAFNFSFQVNASSELQVFGTFMDGENIYTAEIPETGLVILGNEANGISQDIKVNRKLTIPQFGDVNATESLNVANAPAILLSEFKRRSIEM